MSGQPLTLIVTNNQVQVRTCTLYNHKHAMLEAHHVCPESWWRAAGKSATSPLQSLCPNCHYSIHVAIDGLIQKRDVSLLPARCIQLAKQAFIIAQANGLTPALTL